MKKFVTAVIFTLIVSIGIYAQSNSEELDKLKKEINLSKSAQVSVDKIKDFPAEKNLKIYLSIKHSKNFAKDFARWIDEWNEKNSDKNGRLQIVDKVSDADIVAAQFINGRRKFVGEESLSLGTDKISRDADDDFIGTGIGNSKVRAERGYNKRVFPLYSYLLFRNQDGSWTVNFSYIDEAYNYKRSFPEVRLQKIIENRMKVR